MKHIILKKKFERKAPKAMKPPPSPVLSKYTPKATLKIKNKNKNGKPKHIHRNSFKQKRPKIKGRFRKGLKIGKQDISKLNVMQKIIKVKQKPTRQKGHFDTLQLKKSKLNFLRIGSKWNTQLKKTKILHLSTEKKQDFVSLVEKVASKQHIRTFLLNSRKTVNNIRQVLIKMSRRNKFANKMHERLHQSGKSLYKHLKVLNESNFDSRECNSESKDKKLVLAVQKLTGRRVVIKQYLKFKLPSSTIFQQLVDSELSIGKKLSGHRHFIRFLESFEGPEYLNLVYDYEPKGDLFSYLRDRSRLSSVNQRELSNLQKKQMFFTLFKSLRFLHSKQIIHRDVKHSNILLSPSLEPILCDFEISNQVDLHFSLFNEFSPKIFDQHGSLYFKAPEIFQNQGHICYETDVWAAGVTLYWTLFGKYPFVGLREKEIEFKILNCQPDFPTEDPLLIDLLKSTLEKDPFKRISAANAVKHPWFDTFRKKKFNLNPEKVSPKIDHSRLISNKINNSVRKFVFPTTRMAKGRQQSCSTALQGSKHPNNTRKKRTKALTKPSLDLIKFPGLGSTNITNRKTSNITTPDCTKIFTETRVDLASQPSPKRIKNVLNYLQWLGFPGQALKILATPNLKYFNHLGACYQTMTRFMLHPLNQDTFN